MLGHVTIIGCGLIGGSLVKSLRAKKSAARLSVVDREEVLASARAYFDEAATVGSAEAVRLVGGADLVVLATPIRAILRDLGWVLDAIGPGAIVTDTGSVKQVVVDVARGSPQSERFVGGHPMAGREWGGFSASTPELFEGTRWFLVPTEAAAGAAPPAVERVAALARAVGAEPEVIDAGAHDRAVAYVSHAPQLVASALYRVAASAGVLGQAGPGFRDATRIAGGPAGIWRDIVEANRKQIALALGDILAPLIKLRDTLESGGETAMDDVVQLLEDAQAAKCAAPGAPPGAGDRTS